MKPADNTQPQESTAPNKKLTGLKGWLAVFIVALILSIPLAAYNIFSNGLLSSSDVDTLNGHQSGLGDSLQGLIIFENLAALAHIVLSIITLVLLFHRRILAKKLAIATLLVFFISGVIAYAIAFFAISSSSLQTAEMQTTLDQYLRIVGQSAVSTAIWVLYFQVSKRVKATLTK